MIFETYEEFTARGGKVISCPDRACKGNKLNFKHKSSVFAKGRQRVTLNKGK